MHILRLLLLGPPRIERNEKLVSVDTRKATALLAYLAVSGEYPSRDWLASFLWPEFEESRGKAALRRTLSTLKAAVGAQAIFANRKVIGLEPESFWCDIDQFQRHVATQEWGEAVQLYRDDFMAGFSLRDSVLFDDWQVIQAESLRRDMTLSLEALCRQQQAAGNLIAAIAAGHKWLQADPLREDAHRQLMLLYAQTGQRNKALSQFRVCVRILDEQLGVTPLPETVALHDAIRENNYLQDSQRISITGAEDRDDASSLFLIPSPAYPGELSTPPLVGRTTELFQMQSSYGQITTEGRTLAIDGETGIGKTRLAEVFLSELGSDGAVVLTARCYEGETNLAYAPIIQILRNGLQGSDASVKLKEVPDHSLAEVSWLLPELAKWQRDPRPPASRETPGAQNRFYEAVGEVLATLLKGTQPGVLWLDDAHWLDSASLELLLFLMRRWKRRPYLILLGWRGDAVPANHPLILLLAELRHYGVSDKILLSRLTPEEVTELLAAVMPTPPDLLDKLHRETEGLPLFIVEYLNSFVQRDLILAPDESWEIPPTIRDLLVARLAQVDETEHQLLQTAAIIGHAFDYNFLKLVSGRSAEETVTALEKLVTRGLFVEQTIGYDFSHAKLRELCFAEIGLARKRLLHSRIAKALSSSLRGQEQTMTLTAEIAYHYQMAGLDEEAAGYFVQAGDRATALYAHQEAIHYFKSALALGFTDAWKLHEANGDMYIRLGDYTAALTSYETAASLAENDTLGRLEHKLAQVYMRQGAWRQAEAQLAQAKEQINQPAEMARLYIDWSYVAFNLKESKQAKEYAEQGHKMADSPQIQAQSHNISGILARHEGANDQAMKHLEQSVTLARTHDLVDTQIASLNNLALADMANGQLDVAERHLQEALELCMIYGDRHREAALHNNLADLYHQIGKKNESMSELKTAVAIYAEIGGKPGKWRPEIWKLTEW